MKPKSFDTVHGPSSKKSGKRGLPILLLGLAVLSAVTLACLGAIVHFAAIGIIASRSESVREILPFLTERPVYNQITFVGNDDNLWLVSPDGLELRRVTHDGKGYHFPTWAPDGRHLAFIGPDEQDNPALYVTPAKEIAPTILFNKPNSAPFYLYWSPNSKTITFLTQETSGLAMRQADTYDPGDQRLLGEGSPFYWTWSPDSNKLLTHVGGSRSVSEQAHISVLENQNDVSRIELNLSPGRFQTPVWSSDGSHFFYVATNGKGVESIYKTNADTLEQEIVTKLSGFSYMTLSPDGEHIAYMQIENDDRAPFGTAYLINTDGSGRQLLRDKKVASMYWSPDGDKLALLTFSENTEGPTAKIDGLAAPLAQKAFLRWWIYHVEIDKLEPLITFSPTLDFLQTVPFFDQYHLSLTFWSPDSRYFVVPKAKPGGREGTIWVVDTMNQEEPLQIGEGRLAVWSWR